MGTFRGAIAAAALIIPVSAFAAANETVAAPEPPATEQVLAIAEADGAAAQDPARESGRETEGLARAPAAPVPAATKSKTVRSSKLSAARAATAPQPNWGCHWCGRQFVLMLGVGY